MLSRLLDEFERLLVALASENQAISAAESDRELHVLGESAACERDARTIMDVGEDRDIFGVTGVPRADRGEGLAALDAERRHHRADIDLNPDEISAGRGGDG